jgi:hypothetical protein
MKFFDLSQTQGVLITLVMKTWLCALIYNTPGIIVTPRHFYRDYKLLCLIGLFQAILYNLTTLLAVLRL